MSRALTRRYFQLLLILPCLDLHAQRLPIKTYATADGLVHNTINRIVRDSRGFLWFCTASGLSRFDGYEFANFGAEQGLPSAVNDLLETRAGEYWIATDGGLVRFNPIGKPDRGLVTDHESHKSGRMFTLVVPDDSRARAVTVLVEGRDGTIWAGTDSGLYRLENANGRRSLRPVDVRIPNEFPEQRIVADMLEDSHGSLWMAAPSGLYRRWPDGRAARYTLRDGLPGEYLSDLLEDHDGHLWAGSRLSGFFRFRADAGPQTPVIDRKFEFEGPNKNALPNTSWVFQLFETSDHRFWVATARGLVEFFPTANEENRFRSYSESNGLSDHNITALNEDLGGNLWLGTQSAGAMKLTRGGFSVYGKQAGIENVTAIFEDRAGHLCFKGNILGDAHTSAFEGGKLDLLSSDKATFHIRLGCFDGKRFDWFKPGAVSDPGWKYGWVMEHVTLQARSGDWWIGTSEGLYRFPSTQSLAELKTARPLAVFTRRDGLAALQVFRLFQDSRDNIWVSTIHSTANGLARWDPHSGKLHDLSHAVGLPSFKGDRPRAFAEDQSGNVWIGFNDGLVRYNGTGFELFRASDGLAPGKIMNIHVDHSGRIWLASDGAGLIRVDNPDAKQPTFVSITMAHGLSSNNSEVIVEDTSGHIYVGGGNGLDRLDPATGRIKHFATADGLVPGLFRAAFRDRNGVLWFGTTSGLARLAPAIEKRPEPAPVLITGLRVSGAKKTVSAVGQREMSLADFAPDQNHLQIDFVGLGFRPGEVLRYQYKLDGADADWSALDDQRTVTYARLAPGRYKFVVRAMNSDGIISDRPASVAFTILRPFWLRWWFLTLMTIAVGLMAYAVYRFRVTRLLEIANFRTRIATDLHDDIGANLTRIALLSEVAKRTHGSDRHADTEAPLASITRIARESVSSMSDIVWAINPQGEGLLALTRRMRQQAEEMFTLRDIELHFKAPGAADTVSLGMDVRRDVLLIFKEAINNAARHSRCSRVDIDLRLEDSRLVLSVIDNGIGFDATAKSEGQGLTSMQRRARRLNGNLEIASHDGAGTSVTLKMPT